MADCKYHEARRAVGICMRCRAVICAACCTRVQGINHCHVCLKELGQGAEQSAPGSVKAMVALLVLGLSWFVLLGVFWLMQGKLTP